MNVLPVSGYPYVSLSANYPYDEFISFNPYFQQYSNGYYMFKHNIFNTINDLSFNRYTGFYVTDLFQQSDIIKHKKINIEEQFSNSFLNLFMISNLNYVTVGADGFLYANEFEASRSALFQAVVDEEDNTIYFVYDRVYFLMSEPQSPWRLKLYFNDGIAPPIPESYKFKYIKLNDNYLIYTSYGSTGVPIRYLKASINEGFLGFFGTTLGDVGIQVGFNFVNYDFIPEANLDGLIEKSWFYGYYNKPIDFEKNINAFPNMTKSVSGVKQNFLLSSPYQTKISDIHTPEDLNGQVRVSTLDLDVISMKNVKNPNYKYSKLPYNMESDENYTEIDDTHPESEVNKRKYCKIFTGSNQELGYEYPLLTYTVNNKSLELLKDNTTYFHYPSTAPVIDINKSGLKEAGAFPSLIPFYADKVFKKDAGYGDHIYWGDSTQLQNGQWLCAWLSGNNEDSVWMDRWYSPESLSVFSALTATLPENLTCGINSSAIREFGFVDVPSIMTFEPEVWYKYFHVGEEFIKYSVDEIINFNEQYLTLNFSNWQTSSVKDETKFKNNGIVVNFDGFNPSITNELGENAIELNGVNEYVFIPYDDTIKPLGSNSFCIWAYSDDWEKVRNSEIVSNGNNNYYNLRVSNGLENPISVVYAQDTNRLILFNNNSKAYSFVNLSSGANTPMVDNACVDSNLNIWALDSSNNYLYKISYGGIIELKIDFPTNASLSNLTQDSSGNAHVLDCSSGVVSSFDLNGFNISTTATSFSACGDYKIEMDLNDNLQGQVCTKLIIDNRNYPWSISLDRTTLFRSTTHVLSTDVIEDAVVDHESFMWVLVDHNKLYKLDSVGNFVVSATVPLSEEISSFGNIAIKNDYNPRLNLDENTIIVRKGNFFYEFDNKMNYRRRHTISVIPAETNYVTFLTDWSGYNFGRKYVYLKDFNGVRNLELIYTLFNPSDGIMDFKMSIPVNRLYKGWHHFCGVFDEETSTLKFYVDGEAEDRILNVPTGSEMYVVLKNSILLGNKMGLIETFNEELAVRRRYFFKGWLDDFRIYNKPLSDLEVKLIHKMKQRFFDIDWHIPTGVQYYVEEVQKFFRQKLSGSKANHYNIRIIGLKIDNDEVKSEIERIIKNTVKKVVPVYTQLHKIKWDV